jgi:hypothetical protein
MQRAPKPVANALPFVEYSGSPIFGNGVPTPGM